MLRIVASVVGVACVLMAGGVCAAPPEGLDRQGAVELKSAGPLAFGPEGVLFVGDPLGAAVYAIDVSTPPTKPENFELTAVSEKLAGLLGAKPAELMIGDLAVQPETGWVYLNVSTAAGMRGPALVRANAQGEFSLVKLSDVRHARVALANAPEEAAKDKRGNSLRNEAITDLAWHEGRLYVAGLTNEATPSQLRSLLFPFTASDASTATSIEIYHGAHGKLESHAPVRTFVPFVIGGQPHLLAAYTCTPLVSFPVAKLNEGGKLQGQTLAELGNRNKPLDIITYEKAGKQWLLLANSARGVMKISTDNAANQPGIQEKINDKAGLPYETLAQYTGVEQLDRLGGDRVLLLVRSAEGQLSLRSEMLP